MKTGLVMEGGALRGLFTAGVIDVFMENITNGKSSLLKNVTSGYHYHTVKADSEDVLDRIESALQEKGFIAPEI